MNKTIKYVIARATTISLFLTLSLAAQPIIGDWVLNTLDGNRTDHNTIHFFSEKAVYIKGGTTFIYPKDYFSTKPHICITVELKNLKNNVEISPVIIENTEASISVHVTKTLAGLLKTTVCEAESDDVIVHILAFGS